MAKFDKCRFVRDDESQNFGKYSKFPLECNLTNAHKILILSNCLIRNLSRPLPSYTLAPDLNETPKLATS